MPQPRFAPSYSKTRIIADGINTIASHFSTLPHPPDTIQDRQQVLSITALYQLFLMSLFVAMTNNMQIINGRKTVIEGRQWLIGDKQKVDNLELFSKFAI